MIKTSSQDYRYYNNNSLTNYFLLNTKIKQTFNTRYTKQPINNKFFLILINYFSSSINFCFV